MRHLIAAAGAAAALAAASPPTLAYGVATPVTYSNLVWTTSFNAAGLTTCSQLVFDGTGDFAGTGNGLANMINGGAGNDTLDGGAGNDALDGGGGNDIFVVDSASDVIKDSAGTDEIRTVLRGEPVIRKVVDEPAPENRRASVPTTGRPASSTPPAGGLGPAPQPG